MPAIKAVSEVNLQHKLFAGIVTCVVWCLHIEHNSLCSFDCVADFFVQLMMKNI